MNQSTKRWKYFTEDEMRCKCGCGQVKMAEGFMFKLDSLREAFRAPLVISSGYRCENHPAERNKKSLNGAHLQGRAADIIIARKDGFRLTRLAMTLGFTGIGWKQFGPSRFIHLDDLDDSQEQPRPAIWSYP